MSYLKSWWELILIEAAHPTAFLTFLNEAILVLLGVMIAMAFVVLAMRLANLRTAARWRRLEAEWEPEILEILSGNHQPPALWEKVRPEDRLYCVEILLRYARRLKGSEMSVITVLARPFLGGLLGRTASIEPVRRARAIYTLGVLDLQTYSSYVLKALDDPSPLVAIVAAHALARNDQPENAQAILSKLHRFQDLSANYLESLLTSIGPTAAPALRQIVMDRVQPPRVRAMAINALRQMHDIASASLLQELLPIEKDPNLQVALLKLARAVGGPPLLPCVRDLAVSPDFAVRAHAVRTLGQLGTSQDIPLLYQALQDSSTWVAIQAAHALCKRDPVEFRRSVAMAPDHPRATLALQVLSEEVS